MFRWIICIIGCFFVSVLWAQEDSEPVPIESRPTSSSTTSDIVVPENGIARPDPLKQIPQNSRPSQPRSSNKKVLRKKTPGQRAIVQSDGAAVYAQPDFDAPVMDYMNQGTSVVISRAPVKGSGGFGSFYKIQLKGKGIGYIADVDVVPSLKKTATKKLEANPDYEALDDERRNPNREPLFFSRYLGAVIGTVGFSEKFSGKTFRSDMTMFGIKATGPGVLIDGPPIDATFLFSPEIPDYYFDLASSDPSGFFLLGEIIPLFPLMEWHEGLIHFGLGLMWTYTHFSVRVRTTSFDSQELRMGLTLPLAFNWRFRSKYVLRAEAKYYWEKTEYLGYWLSLQLPY